jgi:sarcosine oxidase
MAAFDVVVVGLGAMGSAALYHLARRKVRVLGVERFEPGHEYGSSHGQTRIIRLGYFEHPSYVPLLRHAYQQWRELEAESARPILHTTGIIEIGPPDGTVVAGTLAASRMHDLPHEVLAAAEVMRRFPAFRLPADHVAVLQDEGGYLAAETAMQAHLDLACAAGAQLRTLETVLTIAPHGSGVRITTDRATIEAGAAVVSAGPWTKKLLPDLPVPLRVTRQVMAWFAPRTPMQFSHFPVFLLESRHGIHYGFPLLENGMKVAKHYHRDETVQPDACNRTVSRDDEAVIRDALAEHLPDGNGALLAAKTCLYTMTPDGDFVIDRLPDCPNIWIASACSGHGFKFAGVVGEILADLATTGTTAHDISRFRLNRFG